MFASDGANKCIPEFVSSINEFCVFQFFCLICCSRLQTLSVTYPEGSAGPKLKAKHSNCSWALSRACGAAQQKIPQLSAGPRQGRMRLHRRAGFLKQSLRSCTAGGLHTDKMDLLSSRRLRCSQAINSAYTMHRQFWWRLCCKI